MRLRVLHCWLQKQMETSHWDWDEFIYYSSMLHCAVYLQIYKILNLCFWCGNRSSFVYGFAAILVELKKSQKRTCQKMQKIYAEIQERLIINLILFYVRGGELMPEIRKIWIKLLSQWYFGFINPLLSFHLKQYVHVCTVWLLPFWCAHTYCYCGFSFPFGIPNNMNEMCER